MLEKDSCISMEFWMGCNTWSRKVAARPSQKKAFFQARFDQRMGVAGAGLGFSTDTHFFVLGEGGRGVMAGGAGLVVIY